jgi:hypothetical protein
MGKEEYAIPQDGSANRAAKLVAVKGAERGARQIEELVCVEVRISDEFEGLSMQMVAPALCRQADYATVIRPLGRKKKSFVNFELVNGRNGKIQGRLAQAAAGGGDAVDQVSGEILLDSVNNDGAVGMADLKSREIRDRCAGSLGGAGEKAQLQKITAI